MDSLEATMCVIEGVADAIGAQFTWSELGEVAMYTAHDAALWLDYQMRTAHFNLQAMELEFSL